MNKIIKRCPPNEVYVIEKYDRGWDKRPPSWSPFRVALTQSDAQQMSRSFSSWDEFRYQKRAPATDHELLLLIEARIPRAFGGYSASIAHHAIKVLSDLHGIKPQPLKNFAYLPHAEFVQMCEMLWKKAAQQSREKGETALTTIRG